MKRLVSGAAALLLSASPCLAQAIIPAAPPLPRTQSVARAAPPAPQAARRDPAPCPACPAPRVK